MSPTVIGRCLLAVGVGATTTGRGTTASRHCRRSHRPRSGSWHESRSTTTPAAGFGPAPSSAAMGTRTWMAGPVQQPVGPTRIGSGRSLTECTSITSDARTLRASIPSMCVQSHHARTRSDRTCQSRLGTPPRLIVRRATRTTRKTPTFWLVAVRAAFVGGRLDVRIGNGRSSAADEPVR